MSVELDTWSWRAGIGTLERFCAVIDIRDEGSCVGVSEERGGREGARSGGEAIGTHAFIKLLISIALKLESSGRQFNFFCE